MSNPDLEQEGDATEAGSKNLTEGQRRLRRQMRQTVRFFREARKNLLQSLGLYHCEETDRFKWLTNHREFTYVDLEHWNCKAIILVRYVHCSRKHSVKPNTSKPHAHPANCLDDKWYTQYHFKKQRDLVVAGFESLKSSFVPVHLRALRHLLADPEIEVWRELLERGGQDPDSIFGSQRRSKIRQNRSEGACRPPLKKRKVTCLNQFVVADGITVEV